jgi:hypothetical protein
MPGVPELGQDDEDLVRPLEAHLDELALDLVHLAAGLPGQLVLHGLLAQAELLLELRGPQDVAAVLRDRILLLLGHGVALGGRSRDGDQRAQDEQRAERGTNSPHEAVPPLAVCPY